MYLSENSVTVGVDVGNYDTKTQNTTTPSSFTSYERSNVLYADEISYNGRFFAPTNDRNNQQLDKTIDDYCLIISLIGIAKETLYLLKARYPEASNEELQARLNNITELHLGVGLPAGYFSSNASKLKKCYLNAWKGGFSFTYTMGTSYTFFFNMTLKTCNVFPQDLLGVAFNDDVRLAKEYEDYYIIGVGGGTVDIIPIIHGEPDITKIISLEKGSTVMYSEINKKIQADFGKTYDYGMIENILLGKPSIVSEDKKLRIKEIATEYTNALVNEMVHKGLHLDDYPSIFIGGGALLMRDALEGNSKFAAIEFVTNVRANAKAYADSIL